MTRGFVWVHGWGFAPGFFSKLKKFFPNQRHCLINLGYFKHGTIPFLLDDEVNWIGIGHSYGFSWLLQHLEDCQWQGFISLNGLVCPQQLVGEKRLFPQMQDQLSQQPRATLEKFYQRCGLLGGELMFSAIEINVKRLVQDLTLLNELDLTSVLKTLSYPVLSFVSSQDHIVCPALSQRIFTEISAEIKIYHKASHALGWQYAKECAREIKGFLSRHWHTP